MSDTSAATPARHDLRVSEAAEQLGMSQAALRFQLRQDPALGYRVFGRWRVRREAVDRILKTAERPTAA